MEEQDVPKFAQMMRSEWMKLVDNEGSVQGMNSIEVDPDSEPPCPACGTAAPLVDGACSDCGLHLG